MSDSINAETGLAEFESEARSALAEGTEKVREKGAELGRKAAGAIDSKRDSVAKGLDSVAHGLHGRADALAEGGSKVSTMAHGAADRVGSAADYVRSHDTKQMLTDLETMVRNHPGKALLAVLAVGYLAGRALQRD